MTLQLIIDSDSFESDTVFLIQMRSHRTTSIDKRYELYRLVLENGLHRPVAQLALYPVAQK